MSINPMLMTDFYKTIHHNIYAPGTEYLTYYWTPRSSRENNVDEVVMFGLQPFLKKYLIEEFNANFFEQDVKEVVAEYKEFIETTLGESYADTKHIEGLHDLGHLPIRIRAVPEGIKVPIGCPMLEVENTVPGYHWIIGYLETLLSCNLWMPITSATTASRYYELLKGWYTLTDDVAKLPYACSDFSMRGMTSLESAQISGAAHLLYFNKTANMPAIQFTMDNYYATLNSFANAGTPSTEHSVMCTYGHDEVAAFRSILIRYPKGPISIVSDTYNLWDVIDVVLRKTYKEVMNRDGVTIIRPDSGDPVKIICGDDSIHEGEVSMEAACCDDVKNYLYFERKGVVELLWQLFGGSINKKGYKVLDPHVRVIYGDAITLDRANRIARNLEHKGFATSNVIFGIGSYTYQYVTRDTYGQAFKCTNAVIDGKSTPIYKDPYTDKDKLKKSQIGECEVYWDRGRTKVEGYRDQTPGMCHTADVKDDAMYVVFEDGTLVRPTSFEIIRARCRKGKFEQARWT